MARIIAGVDSSHVPAIGAAIDNKKTEEPYWKRVFSGFEKSKRWMAQTKPDVAIVVYNDHAADFSFDKYPTFALGVAERYAIGDEGFGTRPLPEVQGDLELSIHLSEALVYEHEFDLTLCQEIAVEHGFLVPMNLCFAHGPSGWPVRAIPLQVNVIQHPLPTARRCYRLGQALRAAVETYPEDLKIVVMGTGGMSHQLQGKRFGYMNEKFDQWFLDQLESDPEALARITHQEIMEQAGAEAVELIMWLTMRGAVSPRARRVHRNYYAPMTTGMGLITFEG